MAGSKRNGSGGAGGKGAAAAPEADALGARLKRALDLLADRRRPADRDAVCCRDLTYNQWSLLRLICAEGEGGGLPMGIIAQRLGLTPGGATRCAGPMVERGLIERHMRPGDRRVCCLMATAAGLELCRGITAECAGQELALLARLPAVEREAIVRAVERLAREAGLLFAPIGPCCMPEEAPGKP